MKLVTRVIVLVSMAVAVAALAVAVKLNHLETGVVSNGKTEVNLQITVRGTGGRAVKNAVISIFDSEQTVLGKTNNAGTLDTKISVTSGRSLIVQADGVAFKMQRVLLVPRSASYNASLFFDLAEVHEGNATLISTENTESVALMKAPTPTPIVLNFNLEKLTLGAEQKSTLSKLLNETALKLGIKNNSTLTCQSWDANPVIHECNLNNAQNQKITSRLHQNFPNSEQTAQNWLSDFLRLDEYVPAKRLKPDELLFIVRNKNQKFRAYLDTHPLSVWKEKKDSVFLKAQVPMASETRNDFELTLITEDGQLLQRKIKSPLRKRVLTVRIPSTPRLDLSKRD